MAVASYLSSLFYKDTEDVKFSEDFVCPITLDLMIEPIKINCTHVFEKLALTLHLRSDMVCPTCRAIIISAIPDKELTQRIQNEFVLQSNNNKKYFNQVKTELNQNPQYESIKLEPIFLRTRQNLI